LPLIAEVVRVRVSSHPRQLPFLAFGLVLQELHPPVRARVLDRLRRRATLRLPPSLYGLQRERSDMPLRLAEAGRRDESLATIEEGVRLYRRLAADNAAASEPYLASALNNLSLRLADAGRRDEGLTAIEEAVEIRQRLAAENAAAHGPDLASALNNLSLQLEEAGYRNEARRAREEALKLRDRLAAPDIR
jgi:tetratricopeptide (TPR) repeat protein